MYIYIYVYIHVCVCIYIYIYMYMLLVPSQCASQSLSIPREVQSLKALSFAANDPLSDLRQVPPRAAREAALAEDVGPGAGKRRAPGPLTEKQPTGLAGLEGRVVGRREVTGFDKRGPTSVRGSRTLAPGEGGAPKGPLRCTRAMLISCC